MTPDPLNEMLDMHNAPHQENRASLKAMLTVLALAMGLTFALSTRPALAEEEGKDKEACSACEDGNACCDAEATGSASAESDEELEPIPIKLPNPVFAGTPTDIPPGARMLPPTGEPRDPYLAPKGLENVALDKEVTASDDLPLLGDLWLITDGDKEALDGRYVELAPGPQWVQIDLEDEYEIYAVVFWLNHIEARVYRGIVVQVSNDPEFEEGVTTIFNNDHENTVGQGAGDEYQYFESADGKLAEGEGVTARYVRLHTNGSTQSDQNHYTEIEVWGREPQD